MLLGWSPVDETDWCAKWRSDLLPPNSHYDALASQHEADQDDLLPCADVYSDVPPAVFDDDNDESYLELLDRADEVARIEEERNEAFRKEVRHFNRLVQETSYPGPGGRAMRTREEADPDDDAHSGRHRRVAR